MQVIVVSPVCCSCHRWTREELPSRRPAAVSVAAERAVCLATGAGVVVVERSRVAGATDVAGSHIVIDDVVEIIRQ